MSKKMTVAIAGLGSRGLDTYAQCLEKFTDRAQIVAVADIRPDRVAAAAERYHIPPGKCFDSVQSLLNVPRLADVLCICTPDDVHYQPAIDALHLGYHLLLEKPAARTAEECRHIARVAREKQRHVIVCHVLRYTVFYQTVKRLIDEGRVGRIMSVEAIERVAYWHQAHSFVRGNWHNAARSTPMILQKCCHDMDILLWLTGKHCEKLSSFGHLSHFCPENAPANSAERCLDCPVADCLYRADSFYLERFRRTGDDWPVNVVAPEPTEEKILSALRTGDYGRCVYRMDNDVVDHQVIAMQFSDDVTVSFTMAAFTGTGGRNLRIMGTAGELIADMEKNTIRLLPFGGAEETLDVRKLAEDFSGHGGGDLRMVADLLDLLETGKTSPALTTIERSVESHLMALAAEKSRKQRGETVCLEKMMEA